MGEGNNRDKIIKRSKGELLMKRLSTTTKSEASILVKIMKQSKKELGLSGSLRKK